MPPSAGELRATVSKATYTMAEVAVLFGVARQDVYGMPAVMACRIRRVGKSRVRYSKAKIDALLGIEPLRAAA
ncbi:MAG TPA: hypothetical protein DGD08_08385 [Gemmatimonas aurantiaca]|nr:hypothetical protein [Gemmatimonas aurantiaca]